VPLHKFTDRTIIDPAKLRQNLEEVRAQGYAMCAEELDPGVLSYACPIHLTGAGVLYSIGIVALSRRLMTFEEADVIAALSNAARLTSTRLRASSSSPTWASPQTDARRRAGSGRSRLKGRPTAEAWMFAGAGR
jgi:hypothetical protein